ncbi:signal peptidase I [Frigoribacterium sp. PhB24]|uniref:signal peptidase I n=1 Tax=Frigoribacterium sp. PhB24 TaxID=2485204 RepID=UPI000F47E624|nr:signal peptidase I [Frigoribacterium sp. PhB24]ROS48057.1 signal peptidase I [Frigoribacterium sp. PhB24]
MSTIDLKLRPAAAATASITVPVGASRSWLDWTRLALGTASRVVLYSLLGLMVYAAAPAALGWSPTTVMTGSMEPRIHPGDVVVAKPVATSDVHRGQVLLFDDPDQAGHLRLHRYSDDGRAGQIVTKGDANPSADSTPIDRSAVIGVGFLRVPYVGTPFVWAAAHQYGHLLVTGGLLILVVLLSRNDRYLLRDERDERTASPRVTASTGRRAQRRRERRLRRLRTAGGAIGLAAIGGGLALTLVVSGGSHAAFAASAANPTSKFTAGTYECLTETFSDKPDFAFAYSEVSGPTAADSSGNARPGTLVGGASFTAGSCAPDDSPYLTLDGASGQVTTPTSFTGSNNFTIETWVRTKTTAGGELVGFSNSQAGAPGNYDRHLYMTNAGKLVFGVYPNAVKTVVSPLSYNDGAWHHVVATLSSTNGMTLYVDGKSVAVDPATKSAQAYTGWWRIGQLPLSGWTSAPSSNYFAGSLDSTQVWNAGVLTATGVTAHFKAGR